MKSLATSTALHVVLLTWGLWSLGSTPPLDMSASEPLPVSLVPMEEYSASVAGEEEADPTEAPAPEPTETPETLPMPAENIGDNEVDLATPPRPESAPREQVQTATAEAPPPPPPPAVEPEPEPEPVVEEAPVEPAPPEPEVAEPAPAETPPPPVIDEAAPEIAEAPPEPAAPQNVPVPQLRPTPPRPQPQETRVAEPAPETPRAEPTEAPAETETAESASDDEPEFDADEIAALLNRDESAGGGAQRSETQAALGGVRTTGATLTQSELDALRGQIQRCWSPPAGVSEAGSLRISIQMQLDPSGNLQGIPQIVSGGGASMIERVAGEAAVRAVRRCAPYNLPIEKYETWSQVQINFDPSQMF